MVISITMIAVMSLAASMPSIGNEHARLVRDQTHSVIFICGALATAFGMIRVVTDDVRRGAGSILMSRPISGSVLMSGKLFGVLACTGLLVFSGAAASVWISEINHHSAMVNMPSFSLFIGAVLAAILFGTGRQYILGTSFSKNTTVSLAFFLLLGVVFRYFTGHTEDFDLIGLQSVLLLFFGLVVFGSVVLVASVVADSALVLGFSILIFFFGLLSEYLCASILGSSIGAVVASILPNWQMFWILEKIGTGEEVPLIYFIRCGVHAFLISFMYTNVAVIFFDKIEIEGVA